MFKEGLLSPALSSRGGEGEGVRWAIASASLSAVAAGADGVSVLAPVGILVTLSAFVILYQSYQARGYLQSQFSRRCRARSRKILNRGSDNT